MTVPAGTITAQGQGTFDVTARLTDAAATSARTRGAFAVTVDTAGGSVVDPDLAVAISDALVSNAEKTAVEFAVFGLNNDGSTADVTFTGTVGTPVVVAVAVNGPATANLSGLADGPVAVSIVATDPANNTATGTGTGLTLDSTADSDGNLTLSLPDTSIHAGERRRAVAFAVSGIDERCNGCNRNFSPT